MGALTIVFDTTIVSQLHRNAGWVLIPLIAAAITGIIK
jgi:hypothetical protein